jgi:diguanylate cyclase
VCWSAVLRHLVDAGGTDRLSFVVSLAYPAGDLVVLVLVGLALAGRRTDRAPLSLVGVGALSIAVADGAFAVLDASGSYASGQVVDLLWLTGFALLALAGALAEPGSADVPRLPEHQAQSALPYVAVVLAMVVVVGRNVTGDLPEAPERALLLLVVTLVLVRQFLHLHETRALVAALARREAQLRHQAFHDALTGLANRALFADRLEHALELHRRDLRPLAVLLCDLDDFKVVNDTAGTPPATSCSSASPSGCAARCAPPTPSPGWAATSSPCCWSRARTPASSPPGWRRCSRRPSRWATAACG